MSTLVYVGAGDHELPRILWTGFEDGLAYGRSHPAVPSLDLDQVTLATDSACERKLRTIQPLDRAAFHLAYTHGWMVGYLAAHHDLGSIVEGATLIDPASVGGPVQRPDAGIITH